MDKNHQWLRIIFDLSIFTSPQSFNEKSDPLPKSPKPHVRSGFMSKIRRSLAPPPAWTIRGAFGQVGIVGIALHVYILEGAELLPVLGSYAAKCTLAGAERASRHLDWLVREHSTYPLNPG
jgi:hypothetical protein